MPRSPRVKGHILSQETHPCGRLVQMEGYDEAEKIAEFLVPSTSRKKSRVYGLELDMLTGEIACGCEALRDFREAHRMPYRKDCAGTMLEQLAHQAGKPFLPLITRPPRALCPHARLVRRHAQRHGWMPYFEALELRLIERLEERKSA